MSISARAREVERGKGTDDLVLQRKALYRLDDGRYALKWAKASVAGAAVGWIALIVGWVAQVNYALSHTPAEATSAAVGTAFGLIVLTLMLIIGSIAAVAGLVSGYFALRNRQRDYEEALLGC